MLVRNLSKLCEHPFVYKFAMTLKAILLYIIKDYYITYSGISFWAPN